MAFMRPSTLPVGGWPLRGQGWEGKRSDGWMPACPAHRLLHASLMAEDGIWGSQMDRSLGFVFFLGFKIGTCINSWMSGDGYVRFLVALHPDESS